MRPIDADALKDKCVKVSYKDEWYMTQTEMFVSVKDIESAPTVYPPQGEWEERIVECDNPFFRRRFYCSNCGGWNTYGMTRFCPECGARMAVKK